MGEAKSKRIEMQRMFATGKIVNIGCAEDPADFGEKAVHVDIDVYNHKYFVQADAHKLPFKDNEFNTAVLGDILEHVFDPTQVLREAGRVAEQVVATVFEEWRLPGFGQHIEFAHKMEKERLAKFGVKTHEQYIKLVDHFNDKVVSVIEDEVIPHHVHINQFSDEDIWQIVKDAGLEMVLYHKFLENVYEGRDLYNWLILAKK